MIKSASLRNFVLLISDMLWERIRSWYGMSVWSGRCGWRTWWEIVFTRWKKSSSAVLNRSATVGTSSAQYPSHLPRSSSESTRAIGCRTHSQPQWQRVLYLRNNCNVAWNMSCSGAVGVPCARSTRMAYIRLELDDSNMVTWSAAVSLSFMIMPRTRSLHGYALDVRTRRWWRSLSTCHDNDLLRLVMIRRPRLQMLDLVLARVHIKNVKMRFPSWTRCRSDAVTMKDAGPSADSWMTLAWRRLLTFNVKQYFIYT